MMRLRPATSSDCPALGDILQDWIEATPWMPKLHSRAETHRFLTHLVETTEVTVAEAPGPMGFLAQEGAEIPALYLSADARRRGIGSALIENAQRLAPELKLWTFVANKDAQAFYSRHGFREVARTDGAGNDEQLPDIRLEWRRA